MAIVFNNLSAGGGGKLYRHNLIIYANFAVASIRFTTSLITEDPTPITNYNVLSPLLVSMGHTSVETMKNASGFKHRTDSEKFYIISGIYGTTWPSTKLVLLEIENSGGTLVFNIVESTVSAGSGEKLYDTVTEL